ncbi:MAG: hypothetical protein FWD97_05450 [Defluviitaleaceae bacterium]|nr:hypothetical protein [Defluviitaleaceae bacterium]
MGDKNIKAQGRLTPNPFKHMDVLGLIFMAAFRFGWGNPVRINFSSFANKRKATAIIFSIPFLVNIILGIAFAMAGRLWFNTMDIYNETHAHIFMVLLTASHINVGHALINLLPVHPMSGTMLLTAISPIASLKIAQYEKVLQLVLAFFILLGGAGIIFGTLTNNFLLVFFI